MAWTDMECLELNREEFPEAWVALEHGVAQGVAPGFVAGVWRESRPGLIQVGAIGERRRFPSSQPMLRDTVFDLASVTKVFSTAALAAVLVERRWIDWSTPLRALLPQYESRDIRLEHLLSHTAGLPAWQPLWEQLRARFAPSPLHRIRVSERQQAMRDLVMAVRPEVAPGERAVYSDISFLLLGFALEEAAAMPLDRAVRTLVWDAMGIRDAWYMRTNRDVNRGRWERAAATEDCPWRGGVIQGQVHDDNCWAMGGYGGHAGAFGTAESVLRFAARLMSGFLGRETLRRMWTPVATPPGCSRTLGWDTPSGEMPAIGRTGFSRSSVGHLGFTGTSLWIDPDHGVAVTLLSNRVHPSRENQKIREFRSQFHGALWRDLSR